MRTQTLRTAKDQTLLLGFYRARSRPAAQSQFTTPAAARSLPVLVVPGGSLVLQARFLPGSRRGGGGGRGQKGRRLRLRCDSATRAGRPPGIPFPSLPPRPARPRPPPGSDSAGLGPLCVTAGLVSASDWALCSPVCLTRSAVCGSGCLSLCAPAYLLILSPSVPVSDAFLSLSLST